jgi:hypothetical protein
LLTIAASTVAAVGAVDAARRRDGDLLTVFLLIVALQVAVFVGRRPRDRRVITLRRDLADWIDERAHLTGDTTDQILDRMAAQYRVLWVPEE